MGDFSQRYESNGGGGKSQQRFADLTAAVTNLLQCPVCLDAAPSPIYNCENGHLCCGLCFERLNKNNPAGITCTICKANLVLCPFAERLSRGNDVLSTCPHTGCGKVKAAAVKDHLPVCEYRPLRCCFKNRPGPRRNMKAGCLVDIPLKEYAAHFRIDHPDVPVRQHLQNVLVPFKIGSPLTPNHEVAKRDWLHLKPYHHVLINYDGEDFVLSMAKGNNMFYWWILVLGGKKEAQRYNYCTHIMKGYPSRSWKTNEAGPASKKQKMGPIWKHDVLPFHEFREFNIYCGQYATEFGAKIGEYFDVDGSFSISINIQRKIEQEQTHGSAVNSLKELKRKGESDIDDIEVDVVNEPSPSSSDEIDTDADSQD